MWAYRVLRLFLRLAVRIFFRRVEIVGLENIPRTGPVIFCGNHPNSLLDPVLITVFCGRIVHFAAKDTLFRSRILRMMLRAAGAVPVHRRKDHPDGPLDNTAAFDALFEALAEGRTMGIFPEGISHNQSQLSPLKTGAARIGLGYADSHPETPAVLIPCGLHYVTRDRFRSSVLVQFGEPIALAGPVLAAYQDDAKATARELTAEIDVHLRGLTVNAEDWETARVLDGVRRLYQPPRISLLERVELARRFNQVYPEVREEPEARSLFTDVSAYLDRLYASGLNDRDLTRRIRPHEALWRVFRHLALALFWLPLGAVGGILHLPVGFLLGFAGERFSPRKDVVATTKFLMGFLLLLLIYSVVPLTLLYVQGWQSALFTLVFLPLSGYATLVVVERSSAVRRWFVTGVRLFSLAAEIRALSAVRKDLEARVISAVQHFKPDDMPALFPERLA